MLQVSCHTEYVIALEIPNLLNGFNIVMSFCISRAIISVFLIVHFNELWHISSISTSVKDFTPQKILALKNLLTFKKHENSSNNSTL